MNQLTKVFDGYNLTIVDDGEPMFLLKDVCAVLDLAHRSVKQRLEEDVCSTYPLQTAGGTQLATFINEDGLYDVILDSRKPEAKRFRKWITSDVIPSIRKHGAYMTPQTIEKALMDPDTIILLATNLKHEREQRAALEQQRKLDEPFTTFGRAVSNSNASINIGAFAKMIYDKHGIRMGRNKLFEWLRDNGYLIKNGRERNNPKQKFIEQGLFETTVTMVSRTVGDMESVTTLITGKGQVYFTKLLLNEFAVV